MSAADRERIEAILSPAIDVRTPYAKVMIDLIVEHYDSQISALSEALKTLEERIRTAAMADAEDTTDDVIEQVAFDNKAWMAAMETIKTLDAWPENVYPSANMRKLFAAQAEALTACQQEREKVQALLTEAALRINCAGPVHHRIDVLRQQLTEYGQKAEARAEAAEAALTACRAQEEKALRALPAYAQLQWVGEALEGLDVSEFAESFPLVRAVAALVAERNMLRAQREAMRAALEGIARNHEGAFPCCDFGKVALTALSSTPTEPK